MMILVSYDGSADAPAALDRVAQLAPGAKATVLTSVLVVPSASLVARRRHQLDRDVAPV